jgi:signal transduction histidine kinase
MAHDQHFMLSDLPPSETQSRLVIAIVAAFGAAFALVVPFANTPLPRFEAWLPFYSTTLLITDLITAALLFSQFSIVRQRAILVLAAGFLFSALLIIPYNLSFPGLHAAGGLIGGGLQTTVWLYVVWHVASPLSVIAYDLLKPRGGLETQLRWSSRHVVVSTAVLVTFAASAVVWFVTSQHDLLPQIYRDRSSLAPLANVFAAIIFLLCVVALALLWVRGRSVLDRWLMVTVCAWLLEITLQGLFLTDRFSLAWYMGRIYSLIAGSVVLIVLLSEATTLYAHLARTAMRQRAARQARQLAMDAMAASIGHEVNQPLGGIVLNTEAALLHLDRTPVDVEEVRAALVDIASASRRATEVIASLRAMFRKGAHGRMSFDVNNLVREVISILEINLRAQDVSVSTQLEDGLPQVSADRGQFQQIFLNLIMNAVEAMSSVNDRPRTLRITSALLDESAEIIITFKDAGGGISATDIKRIFEPFFTTKSAGTGVGLTICRSIIDAHGGSLRAAANKPHGTTFEVIVPVDGRDAGG